MAAPTFIQEAETAWNTSTTPKTTASFNVLAGDVLVCFTMCEASGDVGLADIVLTVTGGSLTWTNQETIAIADYAAVRIATAIVDSNKSMTVTVTKTNAGPQWFGANVLTFRGSDGIGAAEKTNISSGAPTLNILTTAADSAIVWALGDWNATAGTRTARTGAGTFTPQTAFLDGSHYGAYGGYHANAGVIGTKAVGQSAPSGQKYSIAAVEVKGSAGVTHYTLTATGGTFALSGSAVDLRAARKLAIDAGSYALTGSAVALRATRRLAIDAGSFAFAGSAVTLRAHRRLSLDAASFVLSGSAAGLRRGYTLVPDVGVFALAGTAAALRAARRLAASSGAFLFVGDDVTLVYDALSSGYTLVAASGTFTLTGTPSTLRVARRLALDAGTFAVVGLPAGLRRGYTIAPGPGTFALTGTPATLRAARRLAIDAGTFDVVGSAVGLRADRRLAIAAGSFAWSGSAAGLRAARRLALEAATYTLTGIDVTLTYSGAVIIAAAPDYVIAVRPDVEIILVRPDPTIRVRPEDL